MTLDRPFIPCPKLTKVMIWLCRILVGSTFTISGWAKAIDPWGFIYKIEEYFNAWNLELPRELALTASIILSVIEFVIGIAVLTGSIRRISCWLAAIFMAFMLPLTAYIAIANPISDCGCFGDFIVLSNTTTFAKNIILTILIIYLLINNKRIKGIYPVSSQWLSLTATICLPCILAHIGYRYQPLVDFRPYAIGTKLIKEDINDYNTQQPTFIYRNGDKYKEFTLDNLPDSTWVYVKALNIGSDDNKSSRFVISDGETDVTDEVIDSIGDMLILTVSDPDTNYFTRARLSNELAAYMENHGCRMIAIVAENEAIDNWRQMALPEYEVYSADDTDIKELVRGDAALVYIRNGIIIWKRNLASISHDILRSDNIDQTINHHDIINNGVANIIIMATYIIIMLVALIKIPNFAHRNQI